MLDGHLEGGVLAWDVHYGARNCDRSRVATEAACRSLTYDDDGFQGESRYVALRIGRHERPQVDVAQLPRVPSQCLRHRVQAALVDELRQDGGALLHLKGARAHVVAQLEVALKCIPISVRSFRTAARTAGAGGARKLQRCLHEVVTDDVVLGG